MPQGQELLTKRQSYSALLNGHFGAGKTQQGMTFPKVYATCFDPSGLDILKTKKNEQLAKNLVWYEYVNPMTDDELRDAFRSTPNKEGKKGVIYQILDDVKRRAEAGEIESLLWDGVTYFVDMKWRLINLDEVAKSERTGNVDTQAMYRSLGIWCMSFFSRDLMPLATRYNLNVIATCHLKRESEEAVDGTDKKAGKLNKMSDIAPMIEGGFRNKVEGLFSASIYLERKLDQKGEPQYLAHASIKQAFQSVVEGKNRLGLPQSMDLTNKNLYDTVKPFLNQVASGSDVTNK